MKCKKCGVLLVNSVSGALCPKGCGGLHPKVSSKEHRAAVWAMRTEEIPKVLACSLIRAISTRGGGFADSVVYYFLGELGLYRRVARKTPTLQAAEGNRLGRFGDQVVELRWWSALEDYVLDLSQKPRPPCDAEPTAPPRPREPITF